MKTRLIVLIDFSADNLFYIAGLWARALKADLYLIHQVPGLIPSLADGESRALIIEEEKKNALIKLKSKTTSYFPQVKEIQYHVSEQSISTTINSLPAKNEGFQNIVITGLKKRGFLEQLIFGSTATRIIDDTDYPIIAIPSKITAVLPEKIILALSYRYPLNHKAYHELLNTFDRTIKQCEIITVITPKDNEAESEAYLQRLTSDLQLEIPTTYRLFKGDDHFEEIKNHIVIQSSRSILVVQKGSRTLTDQIFRKFFINEIVHDGSIPLVVLPL
ncbi:universal stress protein [Anditalea andensis]|uniref:UspA domain-containing protein n=1 Tax=Anditalea andensis TaxID=1048983 RepID=A0A074KZD0_9BACT|nr:universal stress protein [Anditalea andensis]KEO72978.1 hypothetical protein EL17_15280 [Anditalea andensis]